jgi:mono/diheme cytochrome c family protein
MRPDGMLGDGSAPRAPVPMTIARDDVGTAYFNTGFNGNQPGDYIPFRVDKAVLERGQERFNIYCAPCHARTGDGTGMVVQRGYTRPPSYHTGRVRKETLGHFFDVITNGFGAMPDYAAQIKPHDRWEIAAYIRVLQFSQYAPADLLPEGALPPSPALPSSPGSGATPAEAAPQSGNLPAVEAPPSTIQKKAANEKKKREEAERKVEQR